MSRTSDILFDPYYDLSALSGRRYKKSPKKDHRCPHDRKNPTGMELCRACGDFANCAICGDEFIKRDIGGTTCQSCRDIPRLRVRLDIALAEQEKRKQKYLPKPDAPTAESGVRP